MQDKPTALYRYFDDKDRLLYVGVSGNLGGRHKTHIGSSRWMELTARSEVMRYPTRAEAEEAEREAIRSEQPLFNKQHNDTPEAREWLSAYLREIGRTDLEPIPAVARLAPVTILPPAPLTAEKDRVMPLSALTGLVGELVSVTREIVGVQKRFQRDLDALAGEPGTPATEECADRESPKPSFGIIGQLADHVEGLTWAAGHMAGLLMETISRVEELERRLNVTTGQGPTYEQLTLDGKGHLHLPAEDEVA